MMNIWQDYARYAESIQQEKMKVYKFTNFDKFIKYIYTQHDTKFILVYIWIQYINCKK